MNFNVKSTLLESSHMNKHPYFFNNIAFSVFGKSKNFTTTNCNNIFSAKFIYTIENIIEKY